MRSSVGVEWIVDAHGCAPADLRSIRRLRAVFRAAIAHHDLHPIGPGVWHRFRGARGVTGVQMLSESHLACHTYPERAYAAFSLFSCRPAAAWNWARALRRSLGATRVTVRRVRRGRSR